MNRRILPFSLVVCGSILAYACSSSDSGTPAPTPGSEAGTLPDGAPVDDGGPLVDGAPGDTSVPPSSNPIEGVGTPTEIPILSGIYTDGPVWHTDGLYFSTYGAAGAFVKLTLPNTPTEVRKVFGAGNYPIGNTFDTKTNTFVSVEVADGVRSGTIVRTPAAGGAGTPITLNYADAGGDMFDALNDIVARKDGTLYLTDPGYQAEPAVQLTINHLWRVTPTGTVFETPLEGRPNGIALSVDEKTLFVSFTDPAPPALPNILKFPLAATDGAIGASSLFASLGGTKDSTAVDGITVDSAGNLYAAVKTGVDVFKPDGTKWGHITTTKQATAVALGGADKKTLFITSTAGMLQVAVKIAGK